MIPKLIFFDLDGTLINKGGTISPAVQEGIRKVKSLGTKIAFATGRPVFGATDLMSLLNIDAPSAFFSSAAVYDPVFKKVTHQWSINPVPGVQFLKAIQDEGFYAEFHTIDNYYIERWTDLSDMHLHYIEQRPIVASLETIIREQPVIKICIVAHRGDEEKRARLLIEQFPQFHYGIATGAAHDHVIFLNATNPEASRDVVFDLIRKDLGIDSSQIMSFGDGESDKVFITLAGIGIAMGNAPETVKLAADFVTKSVEEDGVLHALETLVFKPAGL